MQELPKGWSLVALADCCSRVTDGTHLPPKFTDEGVPFIFVKHIVGGRIRFDNTKFISAETYAELNGRCPVEKGDILYSAVGSYGVAVRVNTEAPFSFQRHIAHIKPLAAVSSEFLEYCMNSPEVLSQAHNVARGVAQKTVTLGDLKRFSIPLAPLNEQRRIVQKIEELFSKLDAGVSALERVKANLKRYRAAVLKAAVEGKLTAKWRTQHPDTELAAKLLERILKERRPKSAAHDLNVDRLPEIPHYWRWTTIEVLAEAGDNAIGAGPFGTIFKAKDFRPSGIPIIFLRHVAPGRYLTHKPGFMDEGKWQSLFREYSVYGGELLMTKLGEPPGTCTIYPPAIGPAMVTPDVMRMKVESKLAEPAYIMHYLNSEIARRLASGAAFGTTRLRLTLPIFRKTPVPLPPIQEQHEIVAEVERRLSIVDELEAQVAADLKRAGRLRQSILKRAFAGRLVPQDPSDEPAGKLLERIRAGRSQ